MIKYIVLAVIIVCITLIACFWAARNEQGKSDEALVTKDMTIKKITSLDKGISELLSQNGMNCIGCPSAVSETLEQACTVHNTDCEKMLKIINDYLEKGSNNGD